jgi:hypothetical protein
VTPKQARSSEILEAGALIFQALRGNNDGPLAHVGLSVPVIHWTPRGSPAPRALAPRLVEGYRR